MLNTRNKAQGKDPNAEPLPAQLTTASDLSYLVSSLVVVLVGSDFDLQLRVGGFRHIILSRVI